MATRSALLILLLCQACACSMPSRTDNMTLAFTANGNFWPDTTFLVVIERQIGDTKEDIFIGNLELTSSYASYIVAPYFDTLSVSIKTREDDVPRQVLIDRSEYNADEKIHLRVIAGKEYLPSEYEINLAAGIELEDLGSKTKDLYRITVNDIEVRSVSKRWAPF